MISASAESFFQTLIEHTPDMIVLLDHDGRVSYTSPATLEVLGSPPEKLLGRSLVELVHPQDIPHLKLSQNSSSQGRPPAQAFLCRLQHTDLSWKSFEGFTCRLPADSTTHTYAVYFRDITTRRRADEALQRSLNDLARSNAFIAALSHVAERIVSTENPKQVMETLGREMSRIDLTCAVLLLDDTTQVSSLHYISVKPDILVLIERQTGLNIPGMRVSYHEAAAREAEREDLASPPEKSEFPILEGRAKKVAFHQASFYPDLIPYLVGLFQGVPKESLARAVRLAGVPPFTPLILLPLKVRDRFLGDLAVWGRGLHEGDIKPLSVFSNQLAGTIDKSILLGAIQRRVQETDTLREAAAIVTSALDLDQVLDRILTQLERVVPYDSASIFLFEGQALTITASRGFQEPARVLGEVFPADNDLFLEALSRKKPIILADAQADARFRGWCGSSSTRGWIGVPLIVRNESIGYLNLDSHKAGAYGPEKEAQIGAFANQAAIAIENARLFKQAQHLAVTDSLTGLYNRRHFFDLASREFERTRRYGHALSLLMWDIDHFKTVNDRFGHIAGDQVLQAVTQCCRDQLREVDIVGRYGGEEFVALLPETGLAQARQAAERLCQSISNRRFPIDSGAVALSISLGIAEMDATCSSLEILLDRSDQALYAAKQAGRNGVAAWGRDQDSK